MAQLHNLDTLKKHVIKVHGVPDHDKKHRCRWAGCAGGQSALDGKGKAPEATQELAYFDGIPPWITHVEDQHLLPIARMLGDGPRAGLSGAYSSLPFTFTCTHD